MADGAERQNPIEPGLYDPRRDANWQARLEEARAKREIALREKRGGARPRKRLKPWEEEGARILDEDADFTPEVSGLEFSDRVDAMRTRSAPVAKPSKPVLVETDSAPAPDRPGANWSREAEQNVLPLPSRPRPEPDAADPGPKTEPSARVSSVNDIFSDPVFAQPEPKPKPAPEEEETSDTIPIALLRVPPPEPARRRLPELEEETGQPAVEVEKVVASKPASAPGKAEKKRSGLWTVAALFAGAIAIGPIYKMMQPIERGPLVFTLSAFPIEPAFGLTSPMFETPTPTRSREWTPASLSPSDEPLALARPNVPERARVIADFAADPAYGADVSGILLGQKIAGLPDTPVGQYLPVVLPERPLGPDGQTAGLARELGDLPAPAPRPVVPANG